MKAAKKCWVDPIKTPTLKQIEELYNRAKGAQVCEGCGSKDLDYLYFVEGTLLGFLCKKCEKKSDVRTR